MPLTLATVQDTCIHIKKQESWCSLGFLLTNGCVLHELQYNNSRISYSPVNLSLHFLIITRFLILTMSVFPLLLAVTPFRTAVPFRRQIRWNQTAIYAPVQFFFSSTFF